MAAYFRAYVKLVTTCAYCTLSVGYPTFAVAIVAKFSDQQILRFKSGRTDVTENGRQCKCNATLQQPSKLDLSLVIRILQLQLHAAL